MKANTQLRPRFALLWTSTALLSLLLGCEQDEENNTAENVDQPIQCTADSYIAFDSANHQNQDIRLSVITTMIDLMKAAASDVSLAEANFSEARRLYMDLEGSAKLREKVQGRTDDRQAGSPVQGDYLDRTIISWLDRGASATTPLEAAVAKQWVDKTFTHFFFLSVYHELVAGSRDHWDEAYGYFGSGPENRESSHLGLAQTAFKRDSTNGTSLGASIFNNLIDGTCALEMALTEAGLEEIDWKSDVALKSIIDEIDLDLRKVLAYSAAHEAFEMQALLESGFDIDNPSHTEEYWIKIAELAPFFEPLGRLMEARGGDSAARAGEIRTLIALADFDDLQSVEWMNTFNEQREGTPGPKRIIDLLSVEFGIDVKG